MGNASFLCPPAVPSAQHQCGACQGVPIVSPRPGVLGAYSSPLAPGPLSKLRRVPTHPIALSCGQGVPHRAGRGSAPVGDVGCRVRGTGCCSPTGAPPAPSHLFGYGRPHSRTDCCQATGGVARRPVARRWAGTPLASPFPNIHPAAWWAGGCRQRRLGSHRCLALLSQWGRHPRDPHCLAPLGCG